MQCHKSIFEWTNAAMVWSCTTLHIRKYRKTKFNTRSNSGTTLPCVWQVAVYHLDQCGKLFGKYKDIPTKQHLAVCNLYRWKYAMQTEWCAKRMYAKTCFILPLWFFFTHLFRDIFRFVLFFGLPFWFLVALRILWYVIWYRSETKFGANEPSSIQVLCQSHELLFLGVTRSSF